jgi:hypothetical protein
MELKEIYKAAAQKAMTDKINPGNEQDLIKWIYQNCSFDEGNLFFLVLGIGSELADLIAQKNGYDNQVDEIFKTKLLKYKSKEAIC